MFFESTGLSEIRERIGLNPPTIQRDENDRRWQMVYLPPPAWFNSIARKHTVIYFSLMLSQENCPCELYCFAGLFHLFLVVAQQEDQFLRDLPLVEGEIPGVEGGTHQSRRAAGHRFQGAEAEAVSRRKN